MVVLHGKSNRIKIRGMKKDGEGDDLELLGCRSLLMATLGLLGEEDAVDVGDDSSGGYGNVAEQLVEFLIVAHSELEVAGHYPHLLVVS